MALLNGGMAAVCYRHLRASVRLSGIRICAFDATSLIYWVAELEMTHGNITRK